MNTMPTARRGRTYHKSGDNDSRGLGGVCSVLLVSALLVVPPALLYASERSRHVRYEALSDVLDNADVFELNRSGHRPPPGTMVHGTSSRIEAAPSDADMAVSVPGALVLRRNAEYCQWQELQSQRCDTCTRTVKAKDGSSKEESYQCDCVRQYDYVKAWRSYRIQSLIFDQPGAHHNPQRDPMPSRTFVDGDATLTFRDGDVDDGGSDDSKKTTAGRGGGGRDTTVVRASLDPSMLDSGPIASSNSPPTAHHPPPRSSLDSSRSWAYRHSGTRLGTNPCVCYATPPAPSPRRAITSYTWDGGGTSSPPSRSRRPAHSSTGSRNTSRDPSSIGRSGT